MYTNSSWKRRRRQKALIKNLWHKTSASAPFPRLLLLSMSSVFSIIQFHLLCLLFRILYSFLLGLGWNEKKTTSSTCPISTLNHLGRAQLWTLRWECTRGGASWGDNCKWKSFTRLTQMMIDNVQLILPIVSTKINLPLCVELWLSMKDDVLEIIGWNRARRL